MIRYTRRNFIKRTVAAAGTAGFAAGCRRLQLIDRGGLSPGAIDGLRAKLKGRLILPTDPSYENARRVFYWNVATERRPRVIVQCAHEEDALRTVEFARRHELEVAVRAGGHSHLGWGCSNGLVIDLSGMKRIAIDPLRRTARAEGGVLSGEVWRAAGRHGLAPVLGQCPEVGASGVILGGGLGWLSGLHAASCDNLLSARVVAADGRVLTADSERNPDLFWALRGAGANFGVTTSFECRLHPIGPVTGGDIHYSVRDARVVLRFFRELMDDAPDAFPANAAFSLVSAMPAARLKPNRPCGRCERSRLRPKNSSSGRSLQRSRKDRQRRTRLTRLRHSFAEFKRFIAIGCRTI